MLECKSVRYLTSYQLPNGQWVKTYDGRTVEVDRPFGTLPLPDRQTFTRRDRSCEV